MARDRQGSDFPFFFLNSCCTLCSLRRRFPDSQWSSPFSLTVRAKKRMSSRKIHSSAISSGRTQPSAREAEVHPGNKLDQPRVVNRNPTELTLLRPWDTGFQETSSSQDATFRSLLGYVPVTAVSRFDSSSSSQVSTIAPSPSGASESPTVVITWSGCVFFFFPLRLEVAENTAGKARDRVDSFVDSVELYISITCTDGLHQQ